jgi:hypothetical protein
LLLFEFVGRLLFAVVVRVAVGVEPSRDGNEAGEVALEVSGGGRRK